VGEAAFRIVLAPTYILSAHEERRAVFRPTGRPEPSREPFPISS
jgi:hypothetical protein